MTFVLKDLLLDSKDGEWGKGEQGEDTVAMLAVRGTDFEDVRIGRLDAVPLRHIPGRIAARKTLRALDIVFETAGGSKDRPTGRSVLLKSAHFARTAYLITCASFARFLRIDPAKADPEYVFWMLQHMYNANILRAYHTQHTGVARYQYTTFAENEPLTLPERSTQRRIASILAAYDDLIENNTRRIAILEEMARRIYEEWFVRFRFPSHEGVQMVESELGLMPEGWEVTSLGQLAEVNARSVRRGAEPTEIQYVDISSVSTGSIDNKEPMLFVDAPGRARRIVRDGDVIWACVRPNRKSYSLVVDPEPNLLVSTGFAVLSPVAAPSSFIYQCVTTDDFVSHLVNHAKGAAYPAVGAEDFESAKVLKPADDLVKAFARIADPMMRLVARLRVKNANLRTTRDLLLPKLISGELDVSALPEPEALAA